jgi:hypothetical protein
VQEALSPVPITGYCYWYIGWARDKAAIVEQIAAAAAAAAAFMAALVELHKPNQSIKEVYIYYFNGLYMMIHLYILFDISCMSRLLQRS